MNATEDTADRTHASRAWYRSAVATAAVAGALSLAVGAVLVWNHVNSRLSDPLDAEDFRGLRAQLKAEPEDDAKKQQIRERDFELRQEFFWRQSLADGGRYVLAGSLGVFLVAALCAAALRKKPPHPTAAPDVGAEQTQAGRRARWSVAGLGGVLAAVAVIATVASGPGKIEGPSVGVWPRFRGPGGLGISAYANLPQRWNGRIGEGILWKTAVPLPGENSPVVWKDRVFLTGANESRREVYCYHAHSGRLLWRRPVSTLGSGAEPPEVMEDTGFAAPTAAVDGERVYALFANGDLACFDLSGHAVWARSLGTPDNVYGHASSLLVHEGMLLVQYDQGEAEDAKSALLALDARTGETIWEVPRPVPNSWTTPIVIDTGEGKRIIAAADPWVIAYDALSGVELWRANCLGGDVAPSPVYGADLVFVVNADAKLAAIRPGGADDVTKTHIAWEAEDYDLPDIASPLATDEFVFLLSTGGTLSCLAARDGTKLWTAELKAGFRASPSLAADRLYLLSEDGVTFIVAAERQYRLLGRCELGEPANTSPALVDGRIYVRGKRHLYCIGTAKP